MLYLHIDVDFDAGHALIPLLVVSSIYYKSKKQFQNSGPNKST